MDHARPIPRGIARRRDLLLGAATALCAAVLPPDASAQGQGEVYPNRPIRFVVAFPAGSGTDTQARIFSDPIAADWGQPVVVDNRGGANGFLACEAVARARPDGYTFLYTANTTHGSNPALFRHLPYDPVADFAPVALVGTGVLFVVVNNDLPVRTMRQLVDFARDHPGRLNFASGSASSRVAGEMFKTMAGVDMVNVTYRSNPQGITDLIAGNAQLMFVDATTSLPQVREGRVRALAVTSRQRLPLTPEVPTVEEAAGLPGYEMLSWNAVFAPAGTPREIVQRLNAKFNEVMERPAIQARLQENGTALRPGSPEDLARFQAAEIDKWKRIVREANIEVQ
ncbi:Bug family tripartite tricarboxylate transporter substrate binding protein [Plastoroseomonas hellenica]|uniref:Bug family tripartite tricarboxylate transporter substrate binding protein n=1 Tax=Plastoroseomonas hellenica TaxID=2687306 RepID=UPI001BA45B72|nr:tripartite tricarboxylate transporter substrate binding protein [Plastoroseomonas hellenica]MBR0646301.1 tripartite tricarboxylate transporter substrate binding protein [Plastoroseomonas hellenica]